MTFTPEDLENLPTPIIGYVSERALNGLRDATGDYGLIVSATPPLVGEGERRIMIVELADGPLQRVIAEAQAELRTIMPRADRISINQFLDGVASFKRYVEAWNGLANKIESTIARLGPFDTAGWAGPCQEDSDAD